MNIKDMTKEELEVLSYTDLTYMLLKDDNHKIDIVVDDDDEIEESEESDESEEIEEEIEEEEEDLDTMDDDLDDVDDDLDDLSIIDDEEVEEE